MLKKIPTPPEIGTMRVNKFFTWKKRRTADGYIASMRYVYAVEVWEPNLASVDMGGSWRVQNVYATEDGANIYVNMVTLQRQNMRVTMNDPTLSYSTGTLAASSSAYTYQTELASYSDIVSNMTAKYPPITSSNTI